MIDPFTWLNAIPCFPKFYWKEAGSTKFIACAGKLETTESTNFCLEYKKFCAKNAPEWDEFSSHEKIFFRHELQADHPTEKPLENIPFTIQKEVETPEKLKWLCDVGKLCGKVCEKVVFARKKTLFFNQAPNPLLIAQQLSYLSNATIFFLQMSPTTAFMGATPEWLYRRTGRKIVADALAGTRTHDQEKELFFSKKDLLECELVCLGLLETLTPYCKEKLAFSPLKIQKTVHLSHLYRQISGTLKDSVDDETLLSILHPSAALGGRPQKEALKKIALYEPFARGLYGAPFGLRNQDQADFAVAIRSCLLNGNKVHLYAGAGILPESTPLAEWEETEQKLQFWKSVFK